MTEPTRNDREHRMHFMVTVEQTVEFTYPVSAEDEDAAREKVSSLVSAGSVPAPIRLAPRAGGIEARGAACSDPLPCREVASRSFNREQARLLLGDAGLEAQPNKSPGEIARTAKAVLGRNGSGKLMPSKRRRR